MRWTHQKTNRSITVRDPMLSWKPLISWMIRNRCRRASINQRPARSRSMAKWSMSKFFRQKTSHRAWAWGGTTLRITINRRLCRRNMLKTARTSTTNPLIKCLLWEEVTHLIIKLIRKLILLRILICNNRVLVQYWKLMRMKRILHMMFIWI